MTMTTDPSIHDHTRRADHGEQRDAARKDRAAPTPQTAAIGINDTTAPTIDRRAAYTVSANAAGNAEPVAPNPQSADQPADAVVTKKSGKAAKKRREFRKGRSARARARRHAKDRRRSAPEKVASPAQPANAAPNPGPGPEHAVPTAPLKPKSSEDITRDETIARNMLYVWAAVVAVKSLDGLFALASELLAHDQLEQLDEEEQKADWASNHDNRTTKLLEDAFASGIKDYPNFAAIHELLRANTDPNRDLLARVTSVKAQNDIPGRVEQLIKNLNEHPEPEAIGQNQFEDKFSRDQMHKMVRREIEQRFKASKEYAKSVHDEVPGTDIKQYGNTGRTSTLGTFASTQSFEDGGGLIALFSGGWRRIAKDRIDPEAWSHLHGREDKNDIQSWRHHFIITDTAKETRGRKSSLSIPRESLAAESGLAARKLLMKCGVHLVNTKFARKTLTRLLNFKPLLTIVRMPQPGGFEVDGHFIYVRSNRTLLPPALRNSSRLKIYALDRPNDPDQYGNQIMGTVEEWKNKVAVPRRGDSNVALSFGTSFASALIPFVPVQRGGFHLHDRRTGMGKTAILALGESIYGLPGSSQHRHSFGRTWDITPTGLEDLLRFRNHASLFLDESQRAAKKNKGEFIRKVYQITQGPKARGGSWRVRGDDEGQTFTLSTGEDPLSEFMDKNEDREGRQRRMPDIPAAVRKDFGRGSAFETIPGDRVDDELPRLYEIMELRCHGAVGEAWQQWLVDLGGVQVRALIKAEMDAFLALDQVKDIHRRARPQMRSVVNRFALYAASLRMAIAAGLLPWTVEEADAGIIACMERWVRESGNIDTVGELQRAVDRFWRPSRPPAASSASIRTPGVVGCRRRRPTQLSRRRRISLMATTSRTVTSWCVPRHGAVSVTEPTPRRSRSISSRRANCCRTIRESGLASKRSSASPGATTCWWRDDPNTRTPEHARNDRRFVLVHWGEQPTFTPGLIPGVRVFGCSGLIQQGEKIL
jgi:hypothetical protein